MKPSPCYGAVALNTFRGVALHPSLWFTAAFTAIRFGRNGWWHRAPFLPLPGNGYWRFRMDTVYGDPEAIPSPEDVRSYLRWCRAL